MARRPKKKKSYLPAGKAVLHVEIDEKLVARIRARADELGQTLVTFLERELPKMPALATSAAAIATSAAAVAAKLASDRPTPKFISVVDGKVVTNLDAESAGAEE